MSLETRTYKQEIQLIRVARIGQAGEIIYRAPTKRERGTLLNTSGLKHWEEEEQE
jgi:hypothetical protein